MLFPFRLNELLDQRYNEAGRIENGRNNKPAKGRTEPISFGENEIDEKEQTTKNCKESRMKEHGGLHER